MQKGLISALFAAAIALGLGRGGEAAELAVPSGKYALDKTHGYITFTYSHLGYSHPTVRFNDFAVDLTLDSANPENSKVAVTIQAASIDSQVAEFDGHLKNADFFDVGKFPTITFVSTGLKSTGEKTGTMTGDLTIKGVTKPVTLDVTLNNAGNHPMRQKPAMGFSGKTTVKRSEWGLNRAVPFVSDEVTISIEVETFKAD